ncbi:MAG TPA: UDP-N-acetylmuramoyl-L-alanine--D-glutamate ligase [Polyangiaceae bacterium]|nr:UDP-N-acetylmuramoyl-L-alanine--D-glutamate ligase [Polyangiaceae bacterium]
MLHNQQVIVVGLGKSGTSAAKLCLALGAKVLGTDAMPLAQLGDAVRSLGIPIVAGGHDGVRFEEADCVVVSPGVPTLPELARAESRGVLVIGELELAARNLRAPIVAVGGTNGKSTTTTLVGDLLEPSAGKGKVFVGGNLGTPACEAALMGGFDTVVFEVSSFQLERAPSFKPRVSVLLNVSEDHLDRYPNLAAYAHAKGNAFAQQTLDDVAIYPMGDVECERQARRGRGRRLTFGGRGADYALDGTTIVEQSTGERFELGDSRLFGRHNHLNAAAAIATARALGVAADSVRSSLRAFTPLPHRMALAGEVAGVRFYDDSKGTNVGASVTALLGLAEPRGVLIAGGRDKLGSYEPLVAALQQKGRAAVLIGEAAERIAEAIGDRLPVVRATSMQQAVRAGFELAEPGDAVLLSPACSSFDMFRDYADRGDRFVAEVSELRSTRKGEGA